MSERVFKNTVVCPQAFPHLRTQSPRKRLLRRLLRNLPQHFEFINKITSQKRRTQEITTTLQDETTTHAPFIIKQLLNSISQRISKVSSDSDTFQHAASTYNDALKQSGFHSSIEYIPDETPTPPESQRKRDSEI